MCRTANLSAGDSDGFFAVVMSNRIPTPGAKHRACLVSVEERTDLLPTTDLVFVSTIGLVEEAVSIDALPANEAAALPLPAAPHASDLTARLQAGGTLLPEEANLLNFGNSGLMRLRRHAWTRDRSSCIHSQARLVLLQSWAFTCEGDATFRELMQHLNVGMIGEVETGSRLQVTDTGHIAVDVTNRLGAPERAWYRGPLVSQPLSRDPNGPVSHRRPGAPRRRRHRRGRYLLCLRVRSGPSAGGGRCAARPGADALAPRARIPNRRAHGRIDVGEFPHDFAGGGAATRVRWRTSTRQARWPAWRAARDRSSDPFSLSVIEASPLLQPADHSTGLRPGNARSRPSCCWGARAC